MILRHGPASFVMLSLTVLGWASSCMSFLRRASRTLCGSVLALGFSVRHQPYGLGKGGIAMNRDSRRSKAMRRWYPLMFVVCAYFIFLAIQLGGR